MLHEWLVVHRKTETHYWWFVNKRRIIRQLLRQYAQPKGLLLEVGCGGGLFSSQLHNEGYTVISADRAPEAAYFAHKNGVPKTLAFDGDKTWPFAENSIDTVILLDVLEHLENDYEAICNIKRILRPGGIAILNVPAYQFLFSQWDVYNRHYRRYTTRRLCAHAKKAGFHIQRTTYWNLISMPPALVLRLKERFQRHKTDPDEFPPVPRWVNRALIAYGKLEAAWLRHFPLPSGLSALVVLQKEKEPS